MEMDIMATTTLPTTPKMTTPKHQESRLGVGTAKVLITLFKNGKTGRFSSAETANTSHTSSTRQYLSPDMSRVIRLYSWLG
eukprot:11080131-Ditylum_brightwellii.AAC.1